MRLYPHFGSCHLGFRGFDRVFSEWRFRITGIPKGRVACLLRRDVFVPSQLTKSAIGLDFKSTGKLEITSRLEVTEKEGRAIVQWI